MTPEDWKKMGMRIRSMRVRRRITMEEMVKRTGLSRSYLQDIEKGEKHALLQTTVIIAEVFKTSLDYMILGISPIPGVGDGKVRLCCDQAAQEIDDEEEERRDESETN